MQPAVLHSPGDDGQAAGGNPLRITDGTWTWAQREPARVAIRCDGRIVTYGGLAAWSNSIAADLRSAGGCDGRPVAVDVTGGPAFLAAFLGVVKAGAIAAPIPPGWTAAQRKAALDLLQPAAVVTGRPGDPATSVERVAGREAPHAAASLAWESDRPFYIGFSSGSTGTPKAIVRNHRAWLNSFLAMSLEFEVGMAHNVVIPGDPAWSFSLIAALHALFCGYTVVLPGSAGTREALDLACQWGGVVYAVPSVLAEMTRRAGRLGSVCDAVSHIICAGEKLHAQTRAAAQTAFPAARIFEYYGASELGFVAVLGDEDAATHPGSVGRPFLGSRVAVLDEKGRELPPGQAGLLCAQTEYGCIGYWDAGIVDAALDHHGWQTVGDLAVRDESGMVTLAGRRDNMVVIKGQNIYPEAVESVIGAVPGVSDAVVTGEPVEAPMHLVALVVPSRDADELASRGIVDHCRAHLDGPAVPRRVVLTSELPRTPAGKVDRAEAARQARRIT